jgi:hypothetical protein
MRSSRPDKACADLIEKLRSLLIKPLSWISESFKYSGGSGAYLFLSSL